MADAMVETVKLTVRRIADLQRALNSLDAVRQGKDEIVPLEFSGATRARLMASAMTVAQVMAVHDATERALAKQFGVYADMPKNAETAITMDDYRRAVEEALDEEREIDIVKIKLDALLNKPGDGKTVRMNLVPQSVINKLAPILLHDEDV